MIDEDDRNGMIEESALSGNRSGRRCVLREIAWRARFEGRRRMTSMLSDAHDRRSLLVDY